MPSLSDSLAIVKPGSGGTMFFDSTAVNPRFYVVPLIPNAFAPSLTGNSGSTTPDGMYDLSTFYPANWWVYSTAFCFIRLRQYNPVNKPMPFPNVPNLVPQVNTLLTNAGYTRNLDQVSGNMAAYGMADGASVTFGQYFLFGSNTAAYQPFVSLQGVSSSAAPFGPPVSSYGMPLPPGFMMPIVTENVNEAFLQIIGRDPTGTKTSGYLTIACTSCLTPFTLNFQSL